MSRHQSPTYLWLLLLLSMGLPSCDDAATPAPLPPPQRAVWQPRGRMVAMGPVRGYLVHPQHPPADGLLLLTDALDETTRSAADALAQEGWVAFAIGPDISPQAAQDYLAGIPATQDVQRRCLRAGGCTTP